MMEHILIDIKALNLESLFPMGILILGALFIICVDLIKSDISRHFYIVTSVIIFLLSFVSLFTYSGGLYGFFDMIYIDAIGRLSAMLVIAVSGIFILFSASKKEFHESAMAEFYALYLFMNAGFLSMCLTDNFILMFIGLETGSLSLYALIAMHNRLKSIEAALKYFVMGALASGLFAFGAFLFYAVSGSLDINGIANMLLKRELEPLYVIVGGSIFLIAALGFKLSIIPFHTWLPDVYEGSSAQMAGYISIVPKIAVFVVVIRVFSLLVNVEIAWVSLMLYLLVILTMSLANVMALIQKDVKRMLAYSSISHAGFLLAVIFINSPMAYESFFLYWIMFSVANVGAFVLLWMSRAKQPLWDKRYEHPYEKFSGLIKTSPYFAIVMAIFMFSLAGVPPFSLFWGKLFLMSSAINEGYVTLAVIMAVNSAIALYYYLKVIVFMFLKEPVSNNIMRLNSSSVLVYLATAMAVLCVGAIFYVDDILSVVSYYLNTMSIY